MSATPRAAPLGRDNLVLCAYTIPDATFEERVQAAADAGFSAISLRTRDYTIARDAGFTDSAVRALLHDHGLRVAELDVLWEWALGGERGERARRQEDKLRAVATAVGARSINVLSEIEDPLEVVAERFAALCDRCASDGLLAHIEFLPWSTVPDVATAAAIATLAGRPNGGILIDSWHHFRGPGGLEPLRALDAGIVRAVQLSDAPARAEDDLLDETQHRRLLPGDGDLDLVGLVATLDAVGVDAPIGVEVFSDDLYRVAPRDAAAAAAAATRRVLAAAR